MDTVTMTRAISPEKAPFIAAACKFIVLFLLRTNGADVIGKGILDLSGLGLRRSIFLLPLSLRVSYGQWVGTLSSEGV